MLKRLFLKTDIFYQRIEDEEKIEITLFGLPFLHMLFWLVVFMSLLSLGKFTTVAFLAFCSGLLLYIALSWRVFLEIRHAMLSGGVFIVGSQLSLQTPLKIVITK
ncbi:MAG: hypothetical protein CMF49_03455 [Legionellales bacterium]|mgnify:CR=1 FL=1|nr:hypothetical protein [Legionellales bacterium]|tara:strand:+ start:1077 stop:1391 length:315 start_codon:yes stop_codon:yes gene_type:complete